MPSISTLTVDVTARTTRFRAGLRTVGVGLAALGAAAFAAFREFEKSQQVTAQTEAVLKSTGGAANVTAKHIDELTDSLMRKTAIDNETIRNGANLLLTFTNIRNEVGKGNRIFDRATSTITDMSVALGQDMKSSAIQVGKALNDPIKGITALRRVGVSFSQAQEDQIAKWVEQGDVLRAQRAILEELTTEFGGSAEAQVTGSKKMATALGELAETAGRLLAPAFTFLAEKGIALAGFLENNLGPALKSVRDWLKRLWDRIGPTVTAFGKELWEAITQVWAVITDKLWPALKRLWEAIRPVVEIVAKLAGAVIYVALEALPVIFDAIATLIGWLASIIDGIKRVIVWVKDKLVAAWKFISEPVIAVIEAITGAVVWLIDKLKEAWEWIMKLNPLAGEGVQGFAERPGGVGISPTNPFGHQHGGTVRRGVLGWVNEAGPELFRSSTDGTVVPAGAVGNMPAPIVNVYIGDEQVERVVVKALNRAGRRN